MTETELFLMSIRQCRRVDLHVDRRPLAPHELKRLRDMKRRRQSGEPLQYIIGNTNFYGIDLLVDSRVLIPRPETELLVERAVTYGRSLSGSCDVLDLGSGSGNIAITLAKELPFAQITSVDISQSCLDLAKENARINFVSHRIQWLQGDFLSALGKVQERFDVIISNPPYIPRPHIATLPSDVRQEPLTALDGGVDGLDFYRRLAAEAANHLRPEGIVLAEFGDGQAAAIQQLFAEQPSWMPVVITQDLNLKDRFLTVRKR